MKKYTVSIILALALASCRTTQEGFIATGPGFSFSDCAMPSLMEINGRKFVEPSVGQLYRLTNVHPSFERSFNLIHDEAANVYLIQDKQGQTLFRGELDGVPRYVVCVDIDGDGDQDVIVELAAYGNHGNGTESFEVLLNDNGKFTRLDNPIQFPSIGGQENRAGILTWYSSPEYCAVFVGEEACVTGTGIDGNPIIVSKIKRVRELWGHKNGKLCLIAKSSVPIKMQDAKYMTFR